MKLPDWIPAPLRERTPSPWWFLPPVFAGVVVLVIAVNASPGASRSDAGAAPVPVRVVTVNEQDVTPRLVAHGRVIPAHRFQAVAQVPGRIAWRHPGLRDGATFEAGTELIRTDTTDYALAADRARAGVARASAAVEEWQQRSDSLAVSYDIESRALVIKEAEFKRHVELAEDGHVSVLQLENSERALLAQRQTVQNLASQVALLPAQRASVEAGLRDAEASLARAEKDLARTAITMPFTGRVNDVAVDAGQFVPAGGPMFAAESIDDAPRHPSLA